MFIYSSTHRDQYPRFAFQSVPKRTFDGSPLYVPSGNFEGFDIKGVGLVTKSDKVLGRGVTFLLVYKF